MIVECSVPKWWTLDEHQAYRSLQWIHDMSQKEDCLESLANHDKMVAAEVIAGYTYGLSHPYEINEEYIRRLMVYTLGMLE